MAYTEKTRKEAGETRKKPKRTMWWRGGMEVAN